jgi:3-methyladenine DNA glycosylase AlkD
MPSSAAAAAETVALVDEQLRAAGTEQRATKEAAYLKSSLRHYGVTVPQIRAVVLPVAKAITDHDELIQLVTALWDEPRDEPVHERRFASAVLLVQRLDLLSVADLNLIERLVRESETWALVDTLVPHPVGAIVAADPDGARPTLDRWAADDNFWLRRAVLLAYLVALREGRGDWDQFTTYADAMLTDSEFFVRKAIGWVLRDTARKRPELVRDWLAPRTDRISGVAVREAVKKLDPVDRDRILAAYRRGEPVA